MDAVDEAYRDLWRWFRSLFSDRYRIRYFEGHGYVAEVKHGSWRAIGPTGEISGHPIYNEYTILEACYYYREFFCDTEAKAGERINTRERRLANGQVVWEG